jgi:hypothetical protein
VADAGHQGDGRRDAPFARVGTPPAIVAVSKRDWASLFTVDSGGGWYSDESPIDTGAS